MLIFLFFIILVVFVLLAEITDGFFVDSLDKISVRLKIPPDIAGATLLAIGSSAPELFVAIIAVFSSKGVAELGTGTIVGSAIFNILVIPGISLMFRSGKLHWQPIVRDLLFYGNTVLMVYLIFQDGLVYLEEALILLIPYVLYIFILSQWRKIAFEEIPGDAAKKVSEAFLTKRKVVRVFGFFLRSIMFPFRKLVRFFYPSWTKHFIVRFMLSIVYIGALSYVLVESAVVLAEGLGVSPALIGLVVIAVGTSVPDLLGSVIVAKSGRVDMAIANSIGSNIFDILIGLGLPWALALGLRGGSIQVGTENLSSSIMLLLATIAVIFFISLFQRWHLKRWSGAVLVIMYVAYVLSVVL